MASASGSGGGGSGSGSGTGAGQNPDTPKPKIQGAAMDIEEIVAVLQNVADSQTQLRQVLEELRRTLPLQERLNAIWQAQIDIRPLLQETIQLLQAQSNRATHDPSVPPQDNGHDTVWVHGALENRSVASSSHNPIHDGSVAPGNRAPQDRLTRPRRPLPGRVPRIYTRDSERLSISLGGSPRGSPLRDSEMTIFERVTRLEDEADERSNLLHSLQADLEKLINEARPCRCASSNRQYGTGSQVIRTSSLDGPSVDQSIATENVSQASITLIPEKGKGKEREQEVDTSDGAHGSEIVPRTTFTHRPKESAKVQAQDVSGSHAQDIDDLHGLESIPSPMHGKLYLRPELGTLDVLEPAVTDVNGEGSNTQPLGFQDAASIIPPRDIPSSSTPHRQVRHEDTNFQQTSSPKGNLVDTPGTGTSSDKQGPPKPKPSVPNLPPFQPPAPECGLTSTGVGTSPPREVHQ